ncbi:MAG: lycopene cyclase domain protein [Bacteroidetes bacterium]|nr:lycopene cyclase domain protein [Bacteroidota bacterium]
MKQFTYLLLLVFTLSYPLYKSFEDKVAYHKKWKALFPAILISAVVFIAWDIWFTGIDIWNFRPEYTIGLFFCGLPLEEWLFFFIVPFSCGFIYEVMNYFVKKDVLAPYSRLISIVLITFLLITAGLHPDKFYTLFTFLTLAVFLFLQQFIFKSSRMGRYYIAWAVCLIPFLVVNGILTATVLVYDNLENLGVRIYTIPLEDAFYGMLQFLVVISTYEYFKMKRL